MKISKTREKVAKKLAKLVRRRRRRRRRLRASHTLQSQQLASANKRRQLVSLMESVPSVNPTPSGGGTCCRSQYRGALTVDKRTCQGRPDEVVMVLHRTQMTTASTVRHVQPRPRRTVPLHVSRMLLVIFTCVSVSLAHSMAGTTKLKSVVIGTYSHIVAALSLSPSRRAFTITTAPCSGHPIHARILNYCCC
jgi:hypothetical protein